VVTSNLRQELYYGTQLQNNSSFIPQSPVESKPYIANVLVSYCAFSNLHGFGYDHVIDDYKIIHHAMFKITSCNLHGFGYDRFTDDHKIIRHVTFKITSWYKKGGYETLIDI
jgi:hypothetical protein